MGAAERGSRNKKEPNKWIDYQKKVFEPEIQDTLGRTQIVEYNAPTTPPERIKRRNEELEDLKETLAPFEKAHPPPADLYQGVLMANDKALLALLDISRDYRKACITDEKHVHKSDLEQYVKDCPCVWLSHLFLEVTSTYPNLFETKTKTEGNDRDKKEYHFYTFEPRKLRAKVNQKLLEAKNYFETCASLTNDEDDLDYFNIFIKGITQQYERLMGLG
jgi:hypothetical protein